MAIQPEIPDIEVDTTAVTSGKAVGGLTVDATNKHKIIASAIDIPAEQVNADWNATSGKAKILNKPTLATVATSGSYNDLSNKPTIPAAAKDGKLKVQFGTDAATDKFSANQQGDSTLSLAKVADTGSYNDLKDKPTIPAGTIRFVGTMESDVSTYQLQIRVDTLNIATGAVTQGTWGMITGGQAVPLAES